MRTKPCKFSVDGRERDFTGQQVPDRLLKAYRDHVYPLNENRRILDSIRPIINGHKDQRFLKDLTYKELSEMLNRHLISGSYVGLCAAYMPEILCALYPRIEGEMLNMQYKKKDYLQLKTQLPYIRKAFPRSECYSFLQLKFGDILEYLRTTKKRYAILDLDMMFELNISKLQAIASCVSNAAADEAVLALWHGSNREGGKGDKEIDSRFRPKLRDYLSDSFNIIDDVKINYNEGYPMRVDLLTLNRKDSEKGRRRKVA